jgi:hypothetical protein
LERLIACILEVIPRTDTLQYAPQGRNARLGELRARDDDSQPIYVDADGMGSLPARRRKRSSRPAEGVKNAVTRGDKLPRE